MASGRDGSPSRDEARIACNDEQEEMNEEEKDENGEEEEEEDLLEVHQMMVQSKEGEAEEEEYEEEEEEDVQIDVVGMDSEDMEENGLSRIENGEEEEGRTDSPYSRLSTSNSNHSNTKVCSSSMAGSNGSNGSEMDGTATESPSWVHTIYSESIGQVNFSCLCHGCTWTSTNEMELANHLQEHVESALSSRSSRSPPSSGPVSLSLFIPCPVIYCDRAFSLNCGSLMRSHMCLHSFHASLQKTGLVAVKSNQDFLDINNCGYGTKLRVNHNGEALVCMWNDCTRTFSDHREYFVHALNHVDFLYLEDEAVCEWDDCGRKFRNKSSLRPHVRSHVGYKKAACPFCGEFFSTMTKLYEHISRRQKENRPESPSLICKLCRKTFPNEKSLRLHCKRHIMKVKCEECGVFFTTKYELSRHSVVVHSAVVPSLVCSAPNCTKSFTSSSRLMQHLQTHMDGEVVCSHCGEKFRWTKQLTKHITTKHKIQALPNYTCHLCVKSYEDGSSLTRHLKKKHDQSTPAGFARFQYKKCADGHYRLQTKRHGHVN